MKLKVFLAVFCMIVLPVLSVSAEKYEVGVTGKKTLVVAEYENGRLLNVRCVDSKEGFDTIEFETIAEKFLTYLVYDNKIESVEALKKAEAAESAEPENTEPEKEQEVQKDEYQKSYPEIYEREKDANRAIIVVDSVSYKYEDGENIVVLNTLFGGEECVFNVSADLVLENVPKSFEHMKGAELTALKKGDIIKLTAAFSGEINKVSLIFRPSSENPVFSDTDFGDGFKDLFSAGGIVAGDASYKVSTPESGLVKSGYAYAFGVIADYKNFELQLADKNGGILSIDVADGAFVYVSDAEEKFKPSKSTAAAIRKSAGARAAFDEDDSFLGWQEDESLTYAFVRTISGEATEVVLYKNY